MEAHEITRRREALGLSGAQLAEEIGIDRATLWRWETGVSTPHRISARLLVATLERLEADASRRAARRAAYAARTTRQNDDTL